MIGRPLGKKKKGKKKEKDPLSALRNPTPLGNWTNPRMETEVLFFCTPLSLFIFSIFRIQSSPPLFGPTHIKLSSSLRSPYHFQLCGRIHLSAWLHLAQPFLLEFLEKPREVGDSNGFLPFSDPKELGPDLMPCTFSSPSTLQASSKRAEESEKAGSNLWIGGDGQGRVDERVGASKRVLSPVV